jgi:hypothetical protein
VPDPTVSVPNARGLVKFSTAPDAKVPVPVNAMVSGLPGALLLIFRVALATPVTVGVNVT